MWGRCGPQPTGHCPDRPRLAPTGPSLSPVQATRVDPDPPAPATEALTAAVFCVRLGLGSRSWPLGGGFLRGELLSERVGIQPPAPAAPISSLASNSVLQVYYPNRDWSLRTDRPQGRSLILLKKQEDFSRIRPSVESQPPRLLFGGVTLGSRGSPRESDLPAERGVGRARGRDGAGVCRCLSRGLTPVTQRGTRVGDIGAPTDGVPGDTPEPERFFCPKRMLPSNSGFSRT